MDGDLCVGKRGGALGGGYVVAEADRSFIVVDHAAVDAATVGAGRGDMMAEKGSISPAAFY